MTQVLWGLVSVAAVVAAAVWARSARFRSRLVRQLESTSGDGDLKRLARADRAKDRHTAVLYLVVAVGAAVGAVWNSALATAVAMVGVVIPAVATVLLGRNFVRDARVVMGRSELERRAQEVLVQDQLAPRRWAERLAPAVLPATDAFEVGRVYQPGSGMMAGDFFDLVEVGGGRVAAVIGDVSGHGIDPAITAFQAQSLLRVALVRYRDPAQALEELNTQLAGLAPPDQFVSLLVSVHDPQAGTLRYASAGHPPAWLWHDREVVPLRATGPLLMLEEAPSYRSREVPMEPGDVLLGYTDGLAEARNGEELFGEERIAALLRRDPGVAPDVLCKALVEAATDFSAGPITDDVAILAIRRT
jgi:sigma-B regulation protein RsbU (phosphoserine phosphatase)